MKRTLFTGMAALLMAVVIAGCSRAKIERVEWTTMDTIAAVQFRGAIDAEAVEIVKREFAAVERLANAFDPKSELSRMVKLSDAEILASCDPSISNCYAKAFQLRDETGGRFNPRWRGTNTLDLGAIAKGFAVDRAAAALSGRHGILIDLGGNLRAVGGEWQVGIVGADDVVTLPDGAAIATSAEYYRGKHIRDGRTGKELKTAIRSVTVLHPSSAMLADGLSTTMFLLGREAGDAFLKRHYPDAQAMWYNTRQ